MPLPTQIIHTIRQVTATQEQFLALHEPLFRGREKEYLLECIDTGWVSSVGKFVDRLEVDLAAYTGVKRAVVTVNGTAALHICLLLAGVQPGDEVLLPALSFIATANAVAYCGAVPHFVESERASLGVDMGALESYLQEIGQTKGGALYNKQSGRRIAAFVPMHTFGHPVDLEAAEALCERFGIPLIEDAAESLGSYYKGRHTGNWGKLSALSFNGNKVMTTGGGGAILTNDDALAKQAKHLTTTAKVPHRWAFYHDQTGYNYRMPNINAALGCAQLEQLPHFLAAKRRLAESYQQAFDGMEGVRFLKEQPHTSANYWLNVLLLEGKAVTLRDEILAATNDAGLMTRPVWQLLHRMPMYAGAPRMPLPVAEELEKSIVNIPSSANLGA
jgi:perosamine synthetase